MTIEARSVFPRFHAGTIVGWVLELVPEDSEFTGLFRGDIALALHIGSYVLFVLATLAVYRFVHGQYPSLASQSPVRSSPC